MKKTKRATTINPPPLAAVRDSMFIWREDVEGEKVGTGATSSWGRGEGRGSRKIKKKKKIKNNHTASPKKQSCNFSKIVSVLLAALVE